MLSDGLVPPQGCMRDKRDNLPSKRSAISVSSILNSSDMVVLASPPIFSPAHWKARSNFLVICMAAMLLWLEMRKEVSACGKAPPEEKRSIILHRQETAPVYLSTSRKRKLPTHNEFTNLPNNPAWWLASGRISQANDKQ